MNRRVVWICRVTLVALAILVLPAILSSWYTVAGVSVLSLGAVIYAPDVLVTAVSSLLGYRSRATRASAGGTR